MTRWVGLCFIERGFMRKALITASFASIIRFSVAWPELLDT